MGHQDNLSNDVAVGAFRTAYAPGHAISLPLLPVWSSNWQYPCRFSQGICVPKSLDRLDRRILDELQAEGRISNQTYEAKD